MYIERITEALKSTRRELKNAWIIQKPILINKSVPREGMVCDNMLLYSATCTIPKKCCPTPAHHPEPLLFALFQPCKDCGSETCHSVITKWERNLYCLLHLEITHNEGIRCFTDKENLSQSQGMNLQFPNHNSMLHHQIILSSSAILKFI